MSKEYEKIYMFKFKDLESAYRSKDISRLYKSNLDFLKISLTIVLRRNILDSQIWNSLDKAITNSDCNLETKFVFEAIRNKKEMFEVQEFSKQKKFYDILIELKLNVFEHYFKTSENTQIVELDVKEESLQYTGNKSKFKNEINNLRSESAFVVANEKHYSYLNKYLHIKRKVEEFLLEKIEIANSNNCANLILLCGNVGDGKSHLLSYFKNEHSGIINSFNLINDATESIKANYTSVDSLKEKLSNYNDSNIGGSKQKTILAINLGILSNFIENNEVSMEFSILKKYIADSGVFSKPNIVNNKNFTLVNISDFGFFEVDGDNLYSRYILELLNRITLKSIENPFYNAYIKDIEDGIYDVEHFNYELLMYDEIKETIERIITRTVIESNQIISMRLVLSFVYSIIVGNENSFELMKFLPNLIFNEHNDLSLFSTIKEFDPIKQKNKEIDNLILEINLGANIDEILKNNTILLEKHINYLKAYLDFNQSKTIIRFIYLFLNNKKSEIKFDNQNYTEYLIYLTAFINSEIMKLQPLYELVIETIFLWNGKINNEDLVYLSKNKSKINILKKLICSPSVQKNQIGKITRSIQIGIKNSEDVTRIFEIDFSLFSLMSKISDGYIPNKTDKNKFRNFDVFVNNTIENFSSKNEEYILNSIENKLYKLIYSPDFDNFSIDEVKI